MALIAVVMGMVEFLSLLKYLIVNLPKITSKGDPLCLKNTFLHTFRLDPAELKVNVSCPWLTPHYSPKCQTPKIPQPLQWQPHLFTVYLNYHLGLT